MTDKQPTAAGQWWSAKWKSGDWLITKVVEYAIQPSKDKRLCARRNAGCWEFACDEGWTWGQRIDVAPDGTVARELVQIPKTDEMRWAVLRTGPHSPIVRMEGAMTIHMDEKIDGINAILRSLSPAGKEGTWPTTVFKGKTMVQWIEAHDLVAIERDALAAKVRELEKCIFHECNKMLCHMVSDDPIVTLEATTDSMNERIATVDAELRNITTARDDHEKTIADLRRELSNTKTLYARETQLCNDRWSMVCDLKGENEKLKQQVAAFRFTTEITEGINDIVKERDELKARVATLESQRGKIAKTDEARREVVKAYTDDKKVQAMYADEIEAADRVIDALNAMVGECGECERLRKENRELADKIPNVNGFEFAEWCVTLQDFLRNTVPEDGLQGEISGWNAIQTALFVMQRDKMEIVSLTKERDRFRDGFQDLRQQLAGCGTGDAPRARLNEAIAMQIIKSVLNNQFYCDVNDIDKPKEWHIVQQLNGSKIGSPFVLVDVPFDVRDFLEPLTTPPAKADEIDLEAFAKRWGDPDARGVDTSSVKLRLQIIADIARAVVRAEMKGGG